MKKEKNIFVSVVIVAAGKGTRMNMDLNKQYIKIADKEILARTIEVFEESAAIDEIILVINEDDLLYCKKNIVDYYNYTKIKVMVAGGSQRQESVFNGLKEVNLKCDIVLIHDGARPFINEKIIIDSINTTIRYNASCVGVLVKDTIKTEDNNGCISETLDRSKIWSIQTPQSFKYDLIFKAHEKAIEDGFVGTDDSVLVERIGTSVKLVMGSYNNIKITTKEDLEWAEVIANKA